MNRCKTEACGLVSANTSCIIAEYRKEYKRPLKTEGYEGHEAFASAYYMLEEEIRKILEDAGEIDNNRKISFISGTARTLNPTRWKQRKDMEEKYGSDREVAEITIDFFISERQSNGEFVITDIGGTAIAKASIEKTHHREEWQNPDTGEWENPLWDYEIYRIHSLCIYLEEGTEE